MPEKGHLIGIIQDTLDDKGVRRERINFHYLDPSDQVLHRIDMINAVKRRERLATMEELHKTRGGDWSKIMSTVRAAIDRSADTPETIDRVFQEDVPLTLLIDSDGGLVRVAEELAEVIKNMRARGGMIRAYGTHKLQSAALQNLWIEGDERYVLSRSDCLMHATHDGKKVIEEYRERDRESIRAIFEEAEEPIRSTAMARLDDPDNEEVEVRFTGEEMWEAGIVTTAFIGVDGMRNHFCTTTGWVMPEEKLKEDDENPNSVQLFWESAKTDMQMRAGGGQLLRLIMKMGQESL